MLIFLLIVSACAGFPINPIALSLLHGSRMTHPSYRLGALSAGNPFVDLFRQYSESPNSPHDYLDQVRRMTWSMDPSAENNAAIKAAMELGDQDAVDILLENKNVYNSLLESRRLILEQISIESAFEDACIQGNSDYIISFLLLPDLITSPQMLSHGVEVACSNGNLDVVKLLINDYRLDFNTWIKNADNNPIILASTHGHSEIVSFLLDIPDLDPSASNNMALFMASFNNHPETVSILLGDYRVDPAAFDNQSLLVACYAGNKDIVEILLKDGRVDGRSSSIFLGLKDAYDNKHYDIVELLCGYMHLDPNNPDSWNICKSFK